MSDDLTVMGIAATAAAAMGREQIVLAHQAEHPLAGNIGCRDIRATKPSPDLAVALALPGRMPPGRASIATSMRLVRDRGLRSPTLCRRLSACWPDHGVERGARPCPRRRDPPQAVGQTLLDAGPVAALMRRRDLRSAPKGRRSPSWPPAVPPAWSTLRSASWRYPFRPAPDRPCVA